MKIKIIECKYITVVLLCLYVYSCHCQPVHVQLVTTTPKVYLDQFPIKTISRPITPNDSINDKGKGAAKCDDNKDEFEPSKSLDNVKAVNLGEKTMKENHQNDKDLGDDRGEYSGLDGSCGNGGKKQKESVPMMLIHEMDMLAVEIPVRDKEKENKKKNNDQRPNECTGIDDSVGEKPFQTHWSPKGHYKAEKMEQKMSEHHNTNNANSFRIGGSREDTKYNMKVLGDHGEYDVMSNSDKGDFPGGLLDRRDVDYVLADKRMLPYGRRQVPKENKYFY